MAHPNVTSAASIIEGRSPNCATFLTLGGDVEGGSSLIAETCGEVELVEGEAEQLVVPRIVCVEDGDRCRCGGGRDREGEKGEGEEAAAAHHGLGLLGVCAG